MIGPITDGKEGVLGVTERLDARKRALLQLLVKISHKKPSPVMKAGPSPLSLTCRVNLSYETQSETLN
jgi:hypothetical protein